MGGGERHPRIAPDVDVLDPPRRGVHDDQIAVGLRPHRGNLGAAVGHQGGQVDIDPGRQEFLDFRGEGVRSGHVLESPGESPGGCQFDSVSSRSTSSLSCPDGTAPPTYRPFTNTAGVPPCPSAMAASKSVCTLP